MILFVHIDFLKEEIKIRDHINFSHNNTVIYFLPKAGIEVGEN